MLLVAACDDTSPEDLALLSIGERDGRLLTLREWTFGSQLLARAHCPACRERLELDFQVAEIRPPDRNRMTDEVCVNSLPVGEYELRFRVPNSLDLISLAGSPAAGESAASQRFLLDRCLLAGDDQNTPSADSLPEEVVQAVVARMAETDPQADTQLALTCPVCRHEWRIVFDIAWFFWCEISAWADRLLEEVHLLARAYGWSERDILAMSHWRRTRYLEMVLA